MDSSQCEKLNKSKYFQKDVDVINLFNFLFEKKVVDLDLKEKLCSIPTQRRKMEEFMKIIKGLPANKMVFQKILRGLRVLGYEYIADEIDGIAAYSDLSVRAKVDPSNYESAVRDILNNNFVQLEGKSTDIDEIRRVLEENDAFPDTPWSNKDIAKYVCNHFVGLERYKKTVGPKRKVLSFKHLVKKSPSKTKSTEVTASTGKGVSSDIESMSPAELSHFLKREFENEKLTTESLKNFEEENINGKLLLTFTEDDFKEVAPSFKYGHRKIIKLIIERYRKEKELEIGQKNFENFREFDREVKPTDGYVEGRLVDTTIQTRARKTVPIRNFHLPEFRSEDEMRNYILQECAIFTAACVNERRNGTIYFGISPEDKEGRKKGQVVGLDFSVVELDNRVLDLFYENHQNSIKETLRNVKCVPVIKSESTNMFYVIEFDVVPGDFLKEIEYIRINPRSIPHLSKKFTDRDKVLIFSEDGKPTLKLHHNSNPTISASTLDRRRQDESNELKKVHPDLISQLRNHLNGGLDMMDDFTYIFLLLSPITESCPNLRNIEFIKHLKPHVVFDFDPNGFSDGIYNALEEEQEEVLRVVTLDDFDNRKKDKEAIRNFLGDLQECKYKNWVFCNGFEQTEKLDAVDWNMRKGHAFETSFKHFLDSCTRDRVLVVICLFSHDHSVLLEACDVVLRQFPEEWILLSEAQSVTDAWQRIFKTRNKVDTENLRGRCITGIPWEQVNNNIIYWCGHKASVEFRIPISKGGEVKVERKKINEWCDIEVLSTLDPVHPEVDEMKLRSEQLKEEKNFYQGGKVQWLNFFSDHVCQREIHDDLHRLVLDALRGVNKKEEDKVINIYLFHEPGAGGTTSARQVLWSLRKQYRCCSVQKITDQTINQIKEIFFFKESSNPNPILILIDNVDPSKVRQLEIELKMIAREHDENISNVFCVLLICERRVSVSFSRRRIQMKILQQILTLQEKTWFDKRYKDLKNRHDDPKSLIAFNILKDNFNKDYIRNTVKEYLEKVIDKNEETVLKLVAFINYFDKDFQKIHVSCFDCFLYSEATVKSYKGEGRKIQWEAKTSNSVNCLLNFSTESTNEAPEKGYVRLFHKSIAYDILDYTRNKTGESIADILSSLLTANVFDATGQEMKKFQDMISGMIKKRDFKTDGVQKEKFSPIILYLNQNERPDRTGELLEVLFELNRDPFTAQQIARFFIERKNYKKADEYANNAAYIEQGSSSLWDTCAQVFKAQLLDKSQLLGQVDEFSKSEFQEIVELCKKCIDLFRWEQSVSKEEALSRYKEINHAGYFGELKSILIMGNIMYHCSLFKSKEFVHNFLVEQNFNDECFDFLSNEETNFLKQLWPSTKKTMSKLGDEYLQMKVAIKSDHVSHIHEDNKRKLLMMHVSLNEYFGETCDEIPFCLSEENKCSYRRRVVFTKKANSLFNTMDLKHNGAWSDLRHCYQLMLENVKSEYSITDDTRTLLSIVTVLLTEHTKAHDFDFREISQWSLNLYENSSQESDENSSLEVFLFYALYNFPTEERLEILAPIFSLDQVMGKWKKVVSKTTNIKRISERPTTLFFLGNGPPLKDIVYQIELDPMMESNKNELDKWNHPYLPRILRLLNGILSEGGENVYYSYKSKNGNQETIKINTANGRCKKALYKKKISFYLAFSFSGLKAQIISNTKSNVAFDRHLSTKPQDKPLSSRNLPHVKSLEELYAEQVSLSKRIKEKKLKKQKCSDLVRDLEDVDAAILKITGD